MIKANRIRKIEMKLPIFPIFYPISYVTTIIDLCKVKIQWWLLHWSVEPIFLSLLGSQLDLAVFTLQSDNYCTCKATVTMITDTGTKVSQHVIPLLCKGVSRQCFLQ